MITVFVIRHLAAPNEGNCSPSIKRASATFNSASLSITSNMEV